MARKLNSVRKNKPGPKPAYPWDQWLNRSAWLLERGKDYTCKDSSMRYQVREQAKRRGLLVTISGRENGLAIKATKPRKRSKNGGRKLTPRISLRDFTVGG